MDDPRNHTTPSSSSSTHKDLPWFWIIEYLAHNILIPISILDDLWKGVEDPLSPRGKKAIERLALRRLEEFFSVCNDVAVVPGSEPRFDVSETCQSVLDSVLKELSAFSSRKSTLESYKRDVDQFILKKSLCWPECALQQLKEGILGGRYPSLKEESGLDGKRQNHSVGCEKAVGRHGQNLDSVEIQAPRLDLAQPISEKGENASRESPLVNTEILEQGEVQFLDEQSGHIGHQEDKISVADSINPNAPMGRLGQNLNDVEIQAPRLDLAQPISDKGKSASLESPHAIILHSTSSEILKRREVQSLKEQNGLDREHQKDKRCLPRSLDPNAAVGRLGQNCNSVEIQAPPQPISDNGKITLLERPPGNIFNSTSSEILRQRKMQSLDELNHELRTNNEAHTINEISTHKAAENVNKTLHKDPPEVIILSSKRKSRDLTEEQQAGCWEGDEHRPKVKKLKECGGFVSTGLKTDPSVDTSPLREPRGDYIPSFDEEMRSLPEKSNQDFQTEEWTKSRLCVKCNSGGQLLTCWVSSCPIAVHEGCLGCSASFDDTGNFYCPFCSSLQANAAYEETKKKLVLAKEKAALARNHLVKFLNLKPSGRVAVEESRERMVADEKDFLQETGHNHDAKDVYTSNERDKGNMAERHVSKLGGERRREEFQAQFDTSNSLCLDAVAPVVGTQNVELPHNPSFPVNFHVDIPVNSPCLDTETILNSREHVGIGTGKVVLASRNVDLPKGPSSPIDKNVLEFSTKATCVDTEATLKCRERTDCGNDNAALAKLKVNLPRKPPLLNKNLISAESLYVDTEAVSNSRDYADARSSFELKSRDVLALRSKAGPSSRCKLPATRQQVLTRRNKWSADEVEKLKEGVQKFATSDKKVIPWKKILDFGVDVFLESRSAVDLKEKWKRLGALEKKQGGQ